jgi:hypothetical protein
MRERRAGGARGGAAGAPPRSPLPAGLSPAPRPQGQGQMSSPRAQDPSPRRRGLIEQCILPSRAWLPEDSVPELPLVPDRPRSASPWHPETRLTLSLRLGPGRSSGFSYDGHSTLGCPCPWVLWAPMGMGEWVGLHTLPPSSREDWPTRRPPPL